MNKKVLLGISILFLILLCGVSYADQVCYVGQECTFTTVVYNSTEYYNGTVINSLIDKSNLSVLYSNENMSQIVNEGKIFYTYNYTFNYSGTFVRESEADFVKMAEQITVEDLDNNSLAGLVVSNWVWLIIILLCLVVLGAYYLISANK
jgi:hypothetical protein